MLGHPGGEDCTRESTLALGWILKNGKMYKCESCALGRLDRKVFHFIVIIKMKQKLHNHVKESF